MPIESGHKVTIWSIEDKGTYARASLSGQKKDKDGNYQTDWSNPFCTLLDKAYEAVKGIEFSKDDGKHLSARIGWGYDRVHSNGKTYKQAPFSVTNNYDKVKKIQYTNYAIYDLSLTNQKGSADTSDDQVEVANNTVDSTPIENNVTESQPVAQPATNGLVGLDFLNIPDTLDAELPFK